MKDAKEIPAPMKEIKEFKPKEQPEDQGKPGRCYKILTVSLLILMATVGVIEIVIGLMNISECGNAMVLPLLLVVNGVLWVLPPLVTATLNCLDQQYGDDLSCLGGCLEKLFVISVAFLFAGTIYVLVTVSQVKSLDSLCTATWLPPYTLCVLIADWLCFFVFCRVFCTHSVPKQQPPMQFKHLKNLPPLVFPWNRHRALRTY